MPIINWWASCPFLARSDKGMSLETGAKAKARNQTGKQHVGKLSVKSRGLKATSLFY